MLLYTYFQKTNQVTRREYDQMLQEGVVFLNDEQVVGFQVEMKIGDVIEIRMPDGQIYKDKVKYIPGFAPRLVLFYKPKGYVCSKDDPHNKTIYEILPESWHKDFWYIGRLDKDSTGLLLLTNDSKLVDWYENPFNEVRKVYEVQIDKPLRSNDVKKMKKWIYVSKDGEQMESQDQLSTELLRCAGVTYKRLNERHFVIITLTEWKNRHIRRLLWALWYRIKKLHRIKVGKRHIDTLRSGKRRIEKHKLPKGRSEKVRAAKERRKKGK